jgi:hypothetical protein
MNDPDRGVRLVLAIWFLWALCYLAVIGGIIFVVIHFVTKFW